MIHASPMDSVWKWVENINLCHCAFSSSSFLVTFLAPRMPTLPCGDSRVRLAGTKKITCHQRLSLCRVKYSDWYWQADDWFVAPPIAATETQKQSRFAWPSAPTAYRFLVCKCHSRRLLPDPSPTGLEGMLRFGWLVGWLVIGPIFGSVTSARIQYGPGAASPQVYNCSKATFSRQLLTFDNNGAKLPDCQYKEKKEKKAWGSCTCAVCCGGASDKFSTVTLNRSISVKS